MCDGADQIDGAPNVSHSNEYDAIQNFKIYLARVHFSN
jgi:hypothetical protein